jgi:hypothetical protein
MKTRFEGAFIDLRVLRPIGTVAHKHCYNVLKQWKPLIKDRLDWSSTNGPFSPAAFTFSKLLVILEVKRKVRKALSHSVTLPSLLLKQQH